MDIERARFNMVEQQIRPWDVLDPVILELLFAVKREAFVPPALQSLAFSDLELPLNIGGTTTGEVMLAPKVEARLLQAAAPRASDSVLEIGAGSGYMAALLASQSERVVSFEIRPELAAFARANLSRAGVGNVSIRDGNGLDATRETARFDLIVLSGSVPFVPEGLLALLNPGGRLIGIVGEAPVMTAQRLTRATQAGQTTEVLFDTLAAPLVGFPQKTRFVF